MQGIDTRVLNGDRPVIVAVPEDPLSKASEWFHRHGVHHLPVVSSIEERSLVGILSTLDVVRYCVEHPRADLDSVPISSAMATTPESIAPHTTLRSAFELLAVAPYQSLPVVDAAGRCVGIVTVRDLVRAVAEDLKRA